MGAPVLKPALIPFIANQPQILYDLDLPQSQEKISLAVVNVGNPHAIILVDDIETAPVATLGPALENHIRFPERANVGFMQVISKEHIKLRVYERGAGEPQACGSGACPAIVAGRLQGLIDEKVEVHLLGGKLSVSWSGGEAPILMAGPARRIYEGRLRI